MKKFLILLIPLLLVGCSNEVEEEKSDYLTYKNVLQEEVEFSSLEDLDFDITISIDKINDEEISYRAIIDNPHVDMYKIKALIIHNYFTEDIFPSIGIFDDTYDLVVGNEEVKGITLVGYIETDKDIEELDLEIRVLLEYEDSEGNLKTVYYKTT